MSLSANVTGRYSEEKLRQITNPDARGSTSNDTTRLAFAVTDAEAEFQRRTAVEYDDTNATHVDVAVDLVILKLMERGSAPESAIEARRTRVEAAFTSLARVTGRDRPSPSSSGYGLSHTSEVPDGGTAYPKFDPINLEGWRARGPGGR